jgi:hypothetical protein
MSPLQPSKESVGTGVVSSTVPTSTPLVSPVPIPISSKDTTSSSLPEGYEYVNGVSGPYRKSNQQIMRPGIKNISKAGDTKDIVVEPIVKSVPTPVLGVTPPVVLEKIPPVAQTPPISLSPSVSPASSTSPTPSISQVSPVAVPIIKKEEASTVTSTNVHESAPINKEPVTSHVVGVTPVVGAEIVTPPEAVVPKDQATLLAEEEAKKDIISKALEKLLERKIENTEAKCEASLSELTNPVAVVQPPVQKSIPLTSVTQEGTVRAPLGQEIKSAIKNDISTSSINHQAEQTSIQKPLVSSPLAEVTKQISVNIAPTSTPVVAPVAQTLPSTPVAPTVTVANSTVPSIGIHTPQEQPKPASGIVRFFDSLFGNAPKTPPQAV